jgi:hypothetical protein
MGIAILIRQTSKGEAIRLIIECLWSRRQREGQTLVGAQDFIPDSRLAVP